jgi:LacI family transcriptional regulator
MKDVAERAGVSIKTVSRVVNGQGEISEETKERIQAIIDELGFRPNMMARGLVTQRTRSIGLIVPSLSNPFFPEVAEAVQATAREHQHHMMLCSHENDFVEQRNILDSLMAQGVDGIVIFPALNSIDELRRFADKYRPLVVVNEEIEHKHIGLVQANIVQGAQTAIDYLVAAGHRHIGMLAATVIPQNRHWREQGYRQAVRSHNLPFQADDYIETIDGDWPDSLVATRKLLERNPQITAIFAYNDIYAIGALRACEELGRRVPEDCAIVGFDDVAAATIAQPALTTIRIDKRGLGAAAVELLLGMLNEPEQAGVSIVLDTELIRRQSA